MQIDRNVWLPVAVSEAVTDEKALRVALEHQEAAIFRDEAGKACAVEDRCPHRRVPLSLGKVIAGKIRCAYHGWTFDGCTGACTDIPNLGESERVPRRYGVKSYAVMEKHGFVHVWLGDRKPDCRDSPFDETTTNRPEPYAMSGGGIVALAYADYCDALLDGPHTLFAIRGVGLTDFFLGEPRFEGGLVIMDRGAEWRIGRKAPSRWQSDYRLILRTELAPGRGAAVVRLLDVRETPLISMKLAMAPGPRGTTALCWRYRQDRAYADAAPVFSRLGNGFARSPIDIFTRLDGSAVANLLVGPSDVLGTIQADRSVQNRVNA